MKKFLNFFLFIILSANFCLFAFERNKENVSELLSDMQDVYNKLFNKQAFLQNAFNAQERSEWLAVLRRLSIYFDENAKLKSDKDLNNAYKQILNAANQILELQSKIVATIGKKDSRTLHQLEVKVRDFIQEMNTIKETYGTLSKKIAAKLWSSEKKDAWKLINSYANIVRLSYQAIYEKMRATGL